MKQIGHKLLVSYLGIILVTFAVFGVIFSNFYHQYNRDLVLDEMKNQTMSLAHLVEAMAREDDSALSDPRLDGILSELSAQTGYRVTLVDAAGAVLYESDRNHDTMENHADRPEFEQARTDGMGLDERRSSSMGRDFLYVARAAVREDGRTLGYVRLSADLERVQAVPSALWRLLRWSMLAASLSALLLAAYYARSISRPILAVAAVLRDVQNGDFDQKVYTKSRDEIGLLARGVNQMTASLKGTMNRLYRARRELEDILDNLSNGVVMLDRNGTIRAINQPACDLFGLSQQEAVGLHHLQAFKNSTMDSGFRALQETLAVQHLSMEWYDDSKRQFEVVMIPVLQKGMLESAVISLYDVTQIRLAETIRTEFVSNASHELKTPLTAIKGFTETLLEGGVDDPQTVRRFLHIIDKETTRLVRLAEDLLSLARLEKKALRIEREPFSLCETIDRLTERFAPVLAERALHLEVDCPPDLPPVRADEVWINQVLTNLLENAVKYSGDGRLIRIEASRRQETGTVCVSVVDQGLGIPDRDKERVFERFYRVNKNRSRESGGTGLGLSIVKHVIEAHHGTVGIEDARPRGTRVWFCIPDKEVEDEATND